MECKAHKIAEKCPCTWMSCSKRGRCCDCIAYHRERDELPACYFSPEAEKTYDRSFVNFAKDKGLIS
ncbi:hypothetical protein FHQ18_06705 [Deferribacter autotrophicus]|uniref:Cytosolic protein n=1 Tax=Deferribacter autotrophicus TaxID=500465 RepID=A0A5A8F2B6_9BACT|nr:DUF6485 family protein [Deferribacter autotrophicus]KAA0258082.1 hypothetical protein FHQ18_06705 [Deferribacter autotrophicus]